MAHRRKHRKSRTQKHRRSMHGGKGFAPAWETVSGSNGGASGYVTGKVGGLDAQYNSALVGNGSGNRLPIFKGGRRRRYSSKRRGGNLGIVYEAAVPLTLLAAQQLYKRRKTRKR